MNKARARRLYTSGNTVLDKQGNLWNVLQLDSNIKGEKCWFQLMQLRDPKGHRRFDKLIEGKPGHTLRSAQRNLIRRYYDDSFKLVEYDGIHNEVKKVIE